MMRTRLADLARLVVRAFRHLFVDQSYARYYSAERWDRDYRDGYDLDRPAEDARYGALMALMARHERGGPILDVGCGDGILEARYRPLSTAPIVAIDHAEAAIRQAKARALAACDFVCCDLRSFTPSCAFSIIVFNETLYYDPDPLDAMATFERHLAPDGLFIVSMFRSLVTARIWRQMRKRYVVLRHVTIRDVTDRLRWDAWVMRPHQDS